MFRRLPSDYLAESYYEAKPRAEEAYKPPKHGATSGLAESWPLFQASRSGPHAVPAFITPLSEP